MIGPDDHDRRHAESVQRAERGLLGFLFVFVAMMLFRVGQAWWEGRL
jgi:hypothetical protein